MRTLSDATRAASERDATQPLYLVSIDWGGGLVSRLTTFGALTWNGNDWAGAGLSVDSFDEQGIPGRLVIADPIGDYRTLFLGNGLRDRVTKCWHAFADALAPADPIAIFDGVADSGGYSRGQLTVALSRSASGRNFTPRARIGPLIGVNFTGTPGEVVKWAGQQFVLEY